MKKEIKIKKFINWHIVILAVALALVIGASNVIAKEKCEEGRSCAYRSVLLDCESKGVCPGKKIGDPNYQECCKPLKDSTIIFFGNAVDTDSLDGFIMIAIAISKWILGIIGSLALAFFIYGGIMFMISGGSSEKVTKAKQILIGAVIGLIIVFASYMIINFIFQAMGIKANNWNQSGWFFD
jgi:hypothetical protein